MKKRKMDAKNLSGFFIFRDRKNRTYYSLPKSSKGYLINDSDAYTYYLYQIRPMAAIAIVLLSLAINVDYWKYGLIVAAVFYIISTLFFYFGFLKKLPLIKDLEKQEKNSIIDEQMNSSTKKLVLMSVFCLLLSAVLLLALIKNGENISSLKYMLILAVMILYGIYGLIETVALIKKLLSKNKAN